MARKTARAGLLALLAASLVSGWQGFNSFRASGAGQLLVDRTLDEYRAAMDRAVAREATTGHVAGLLSSYLSAEPRDWLAMEAVLGVASERGLPLHPTLIGRIEDAWAEDNSYLALAGDCMKCTWDIGECSLTTGLICNAPVTFSPVGDVLGLVAEGTNAALGRDVDKLNLTLSALGLGATAALLASGGSSLSVKAGASGLKLARGMRLLSAGFTRYLTRTADLVVDVPALRRVRSASDLPAVFRRAPLEEMGRVADDLFRVSQATDTRTALRLLPYVDAPDDARRLARAAEAAGPKVLGRAEVLGKARFFRLSVRVADGMVLLGGGVAGLIAAMAAMAQAFGLRMARGLLRRV